MPQPLTLCTAQDIEKMINTTSKALELQEQMAEMLANPVTGPIPVGSFKGRRHTYAIYDEDVDNKKRAKGGVKTK